MKNMKAALVGLALICAGASFADVKVGVTVSATGPAASLGIPEKNTIEMLPKTIAGEKIEYIVLDDASVPDQATKNTRRFIADEKVDLIIGSTISSNSLAMVELVADGKTPLISLAAAAAIVTPMDDKRKWVFKTPQSDWMMSQAIAKDMVARKVKKVGFIGFSNAYGDGWLKEFTKAAAENKIEIVAEERFAPTDTSATPQALKLIAKKPDAILIASSGVPSLVPQRALNERGYKRLIYQTHGVANADFLRVGGKLVNGTILPAGPVLVASQLPASHPSKKVGLDYVEKYEGQHGKNSVSLFGGYAWDAGLLLQAALPVALKVAKPGTPEFRAALRDALENLKDVAGVHGVYSMTPTDHLGLDSRSVVMVKIVNDGWQYQK